MKYSFRPKPGPKRPYHFGISSESTPVWHRAKKNSFKKPTSHSRWGLPAAATHPLEGTDACPTHSISGAKSKQNSIENPLWIFYIFSNLYLNLSKIRRTSVESPSFRNASEILFKSLRNSTEILSKSFLNLRENLFKFYRNVIRTLSAFYWNSGNFFLRSSIENPS